MGQYEFLDTWCLDAPIDRVFSAIEDSARWPEWWRGMRSAELLEDGDENGVSRLWRYVWRNRRPYNREFDSRAGGSSRAEAPPSSTSGTCAPLDRG